MEAQQPLQRSSQERHVARKTVKPETFLKSLICYRKLIVNGWEVNRCETLNSKLSNSGIKIKLEVLGRTKYLLSFHYVLSN
jgi:hypothetical protein